MAHNRGPFEYEESRQGKNAKEQDIFVASRLEK
jgi:hypothetical protein